MEIIIGSFQSFLFPRPSFFLKKINIKPKDNPTKRDIKKGLSNLKYPVLSIIVFSKKSIETIGANSWLPG